MHQSRMEIETPRAPVDASTRDRLVEAAAAEFNAVGFHGTNTNKIAKAAGFSPQTFYRHFEDKIEIFLAVYDSWQASERHAVTRALKSAAGAATIAKVVLEHHETWRVFRQSLRLLAVNDLRVRRARAASRERQLDSLGRVPANAGRPRAELVAALLSIERLSDAAADGELGDLGVAPDAALTVLADAIRAARSPVAD